MLGAIKKAIDNAKNTIAKPPIDAAATAAKMMAPATAAAEAAKAAATPPPTVPKIAPPPPAPVAPPPAPTPPPPAAAVAAPPPMKIDTGAVRAEFDYARNKAAQQAATQLQDQRDVMARRQAQLGGGPSGAFLKLEGQAVDANNQRLDDINQGITAAQSAEMRRLAELQSGQDLQKYGIDTSAALQGRGQDIQLYGIGVDKGLKEGELTGTYGGQQTLAAKGQDAQTKLAEAGLTGVMPDGTKTLASQAQEHTIKQDELETKANLLTNYITNILSGKNSGIPPEKMAQLISGLGVSIGPNGELNFSAPSVEGLTTPKVEAPKPVQPSSVQPGTDGIYKPGYVYVNGVRKYRNADGTLEDAPM